jgi:UDP-N-acetylmuramate dehydrogenase
VKPGQEAFIRAKMEGSLARRKRTQPLDFPSCGSVFRNPSGQHAGALIEGCGLSGTRIGGAQISGKHANFIVNTGEASAHDVIELIQLAQHKVKQEHGIELKPEVRFLGF